MAFDKSRTKVPCPPQLLQIAGLGGGEIKKRSLKDLLHLIT